MIMYMLSIILSAAFLPLAYAAPWHIVHARQSNNNDPNNGPNANNNNNNNNSGGLSSSVWVCVSFILANTGP